jgi:hypothetical protein
MRMIQDEGIDIHPIGNAHEGLPILFELKSEELARKIRQALAERESFMDIDSASRRLVGSS